MPPIEEDAEDLVGRADVLLGLPCWCWFPARHCPIRALSPLMCTHVNEFRASPGDTDIGDAPERACRTARLPRPAVGRRSARTRRPGDRMACSGRACGVGTRATSCRSSGRYATAVSSCRGRSLHLRPQLPDLRRSEHTRDRFRCGSCRRGCGPLVLDLAARDRRRVPRRRFRIVRGAHVCRSSWIMGLLGASDGPSRGLRLLGSLHRTCRCGGYRWRALDAHPSRTAHRAS